MHTLTTSNASPFRWESIGLHDLNIAVNGNDSSHRSLALCHERAWWWSFWMSKVTKLNFFPVHRIENSSRIDTKNCEAGFLEKRHVFSKFEPVQTNNAYWRTELSITNTMSNTTSTCLTGAPPLTLQQQSFCNLGFFCRLLSIILYRFIWRQYQVPIFLPATHLNTVHQYCNVKLRGYHKLLIPAESPKACMSLLFVHLVITVHRAASPSWYVLQSTIVRLGPFNLFLVPIGRSVHPTVNVKLRWWVWLQLSL